MSKQYIVSQIYGYIICAITLLLVILTLTTLTRYFIDLSNPVASANLSNRYLSFDNFKINYNEKHPNILSRDINKNNSVNAPALTDAVLQKQYTEERKSIIDRSLYRIKKNIVSDMVTFIMSLILFFFHWKWVRKFVAKPEPAISHSTGEGNQ